MRTSSRINSEFIDHLSNFLAENKVEAEALKTLVNTPIDKKTQGKWQRIFDCLETSFHISQGDPRMNELVQSYERIGKAKDQSVQKELFVRTVLEKYAFPDLINMDAIIKMLGFTDENYASKTQEEKIQIATYITKAYLFYFFSAIFLEFLNRNPDNNKNLNVINFEDIQKELVTVENLKGAANLQTYLENEEKEYTGFVFAHRCILGLAKEHGLPGWDHERALCSNLLTMLFAAHPDLPQKLQACEGGYHLLGKNHLEAFKALIPAHPEKKPAFFNK